MPNCALFVGSEIYRAKAFGSHHPLAIPRAELVNDLCRSLGWLSNETFVESPQADCQDLYLFHDQNYVEALRLADATGRVSLDVRERYAIGTMENPLFPGVFARAATTVGGSILAAQLAAQGRTLFHPAGGTHHGRRDRASGFCFFNDPVFAVLTLRQAGCARVFYVDLDAHHGDGVQAAFASSKAVMDGVMTVSIHEAGRWPHTGGVDDRGNGWARNLPVPSGFNDSELAFLMAEAVVPLAERFRPDAVVVTCGADGLVGDPLTNLALSNVALWQAVQRVCELTTANVVLGGGGYNPWTLARCWTGLWGVLGGQDIPTSLPEPARAMLAGLSCNLIEEEDVRPAWIENLVDQPCVGPIRDEVKALPALVLRD